MPSFIRTCILITVFSASLACDEGSNFDSTELRASDSVGGHVRVLEDPHELLIVDGLELHAVIDPATTPQDISTGVIEAEATVIVEGRLGDPLKVKLKITVLPRDDRRSAVGALLPVGLESDE